jgi:N-glycosylase/DNA lyase
MLNVTPSQLKRAVFVVCDDIEQRIAGSPSISLDETSLWRELSCCILSSQVPYPLAQAASDEIHSTAVLMDRSKSVDELSAQLFETLSGRFVVGSSYRRYRFPASRSRHLALSWKVINDNGGLSKLLAQKPDVQELRHWLVTNAHGIGPKQASMFLRNSGISYELAILDRHVLRYMEIVGLGPVTPDISSLNAYRARELLLQTHAEELGYDVGLLDWAIWIVMRVARSYVGRLIT